MQRPGLDEQVRDELRALLLVCEVLERIPQTSVGSPRALAEDFARTLHEEMDFRLEADNMERMRRILVDEQITDARVPVVHHDLVGRRVLTMERIRGFQLTDVEGMKAAGVDTERLLRMAVQTVVEGVLVHGFFHGDLHAGNIAVLSDGTFVLFDFGIVGRLTESARARLATYLMAVTTNDYASMVRALRSFGSVPADVSVEEMAAEIQRLYEPFVTDGVVVAQLGELMDTMIRSMVQYRVRIPPRAGAALEADALPRGRRPDPGPRCRPAPGAADHLRLADDEVPRPGRGDHAEHPARRRDGHRHRFGRARLTHATSRTAHDPAPRSASALPAQS